MIGETGTDPQINPPESETNQDTALPLLPSEDGSSQNTQPNQPLTELGESVDQANLSGMELAGQEPVRAESPMAINELATEFHRDKEVVTLPVDKLPPEPAEELDKNLDNKTTDIYPTFAAAEKKVDPGTIEPPPVVAEPENVEVPPADNP